MGEVIGDLVSFFFSFFFVMRAGGGGEKCSADFSSRTAGQCFSYIGS